jgi:dihydropteroate synthase
MAGFPQIMGIVNVTPDSFSDGGLYADPVRAVEHALELVEEGRRPARYRRREHAPGCSARAR